MSDSVHKVPAGKSDLGHDPFEEFQALINLASGIAAYDQMFDEVASAVATAARYGVEFDALDEQARKALVRYVFGEARFRRLRFSANQVQRAFEALGHSHFLKEPLPVDMDVYRDAMLYLASPVLRDHMGRELFLCLPEYLAADRCIEAAAILFFGLQLALQQDQTNTFLEIMFEHGFVDWVINGDAEATPPEGERQGEIGEQPANPKVEGSLRAGPELDTPDVDLAWIENEAKWHPFVEILWWPPGRQFLLSPDEIEPWILRYYARLQPDEARLEESFKAGERDFRSFRDRVEVEYARATHEMASELLIGERTTELVAEVLSYRDRHRQAGDHKRAAYAGLLLAALESPERHEHRIAKFAICYLSMRDALGSRRETMETE